MNTIKAIAVLLIFALFLNLALIALGKISIFAFWIILGIVAIPAYLVLPRLSRGS